MPRSKVWGSEILQEGYTSISKTAKRWDLSRARVHKMCQEGIIPGAYQDQETERWHIPEDAERPAARQRGPGQKTREA